MLTALRLASKVWKHSRVVAVNCNLNEIHFVIWDKYFYQCETNTFSNKIWKHSPVVAVNRNGEHVVENSTAFSAETSKAWERLDSAETTIDFFCREKRKFQSNCFFGWNFQSLGEETALKKPTSTESKYLINSDNKMAMHRFIDILDICVRPFGPFLWRARRNLLF